MDNITVRRWVAAPPIAVWHQLLHLRRSALPDAVLDLEELLGAAADGTQGSRDLPRTGARVERVELGARDRVTQEPREATVVLDAGGERWLLTISVAELPGGVCSHSDVRLHAVRDPTLPRPRGPRSLARRRGHRVARDLSHLLDAVACRLSRIEGGTPQRMAPGR